MSVLMWVGVTPSAFADDTVNTCGRIAGEYPGSFFFRVGTCNYTGTIVSLVLAIMVIGYFLARRGAFGVELKKRTPSDPTDEENYERM